MEWTHDKTFMLMRVVSCWRSAAWTARGELGGAKEFVSHSKSSEAIANCRPPRIGHTVRARQNDVPGLVAVYAGDGDFLVRRSSTRLLVLK